MDPTGFDIFSLDHGTLTGLTLTIMVGARGLFPWLFTNKYMEMAMPVLVVAVAVVLALIGFGGASGVLLVKAKAGFVAGVTAAWIYKVGKTTGATQAMSNAATKVTKLVIKPKVQPVDPADKQTDKEEV